MGRPNVSITVTDGNLGRSTEKPKEYLLVCADKMGERVSIDAPTIERNVTSLKAFEALGYSHDNDVDVTSQAPQLTWEHVKDFYEEAPAGTIVHVLIVDYRTELQDILLLTQRELVSRNGAISVVAISLVTNDIAGGSYGWLKNIANGGASAQLLRFRELVAREFAGHRPVQLVVGLQGYDWSYDDSPSFRVPQKDFFYGCISLFAGYNKDRAAQLVSDFESSSGDNSSKAYSVFQDYCQVGKLLGKVAATPIHQNIGQITNDSLTEIPLKGITANSAMLSGSNGLRSDVITRSWGTDFIGTLYDRGLIFYVEHAQFDGVFYCGGNNCAAPDSDFAQIERVSVMNEVCRVAYKEYMRLALLKAIILDAEGKISAIALKNLEQSVKTKIEDVLAGKIVSADVYVSPDQNVLATDTVEVQLSVVPFGLGKQISVTVGYSNPNS